MIDRAQTDFVVPNVRVIGGTEAAAVQDGAARVGRAARGTRDVLAAKLARKQQADDAAAIIETENNYVLRLQEIEETARNEAPESGDGYLNAIKEKRTKARDEVLKAVPSFVSAAGREQVDRVIQRLDGDSNLRATRWQDERATAFALNGFGKALGTGVTAVMAAPEAAETERARAHTRLQAISGRLDPAEEAAQRARIDSEIAVAAVQGLADGGDFAAAREYAKQSAEVLTSDNKRALKSYIEQAETELEQKTYERFSLGIQEGAVTLETLKIARDAGEIPDDGYYRALKDQVRVRDEAAERERKVAEAEAQAATYADLRVGIDDGRYTRQDVDLAYQRGHINDAQWTQAALSANDKASGNTVAAEFASALQLGLPIDPSNSDMKKGAEAVFQARGGQGVFVEDFTAGLALTEQFAQAGIIPETPRTVLRGMKASGTPEQQMAAIDAIAGLYAEYPNATDAAFSAGEVAEAISFQDKLDAGIDANQAFQAVLKEREARNEPAGVTSQTKARIAEGRKIASEFDRGDAVKGISRGGLFGTGLFGSGFSGGVLAEEQIVTDYQAAFQTYYVQHGDEKLAKKQANAVLQRTVGTSRANGGRIMLHPPERYYPETGNKTWMRDTLTAGVSEAMGVDVDADQIELISDGETARAVRDGQRPTYAVKVRAGGADQVLPQRWSFDAELAEQMATERQEAERMAGRDRAAQKRARRAEQIAEWAKPQKDSIAWNAMSESEQAAAEEAYARALDDAQRAKRAAGLE